MLKVLKKEDIRFRVQITDLKTKKSKSFSLIDGDYNLDKLKERLEKSLADSKK